MGAVSADGGGSDIVVLGDAANTAARLASVAKRGEIIIGEATRAAARLQPKGMEAHHLQLKGRSEAIDAWSIPVLP